MKLTAYHDERGNIVAVIARPDDAPAAHIDLGRPGLHRTEVESDEFTDQPDPEQLQERLATLMSSQRIEVDGPTARLSDKS
jgi:hypothetical protein